MGTVKEILVSVLIEDWYYGLALAFIVSFVFFVLLEQIEKSLGRPAAIALGALGIGLYLWLAVALFSAYALFSVGLMLVGALVLYFAYFAYFSKEKTKKKEPPSGQ
ncbi:MAG: hypothetical protein VB092_02205 [Oscillospiraceae bacterium]|nr:hypothetical protein [Oscillospiraceae bacterium]